MENSPQGNKNSGPRRWFLQHEVTTVVLKPWFWLAFQAILLFIVLEFAGRLKVHNPDGYDDQEYQELSKVPFGKLISFPDETTYRTLGYPIFLKCVAYFSPSYSALPHCQLALHVLGVFALYWGLRQIGLSGSLAIASASCLLYSNLILLNNAFGMSLSYLQLLVTDAPASSLAILTIGLLLGVIARSANILAWVGLTVSLFLTYQFRPAYLFLLPLVPLLGVVLLWLITPWPKKLRRCVSVGLGLVAVCTLPFLAFCTYRWENVGHFGLTSFGGLTSIGIAGQFLTDDLVPELPEDVRPFALKALERRKKLVKGEIPCSMPPLPSLAERADQLPRVARWLPASGEPQDWDTLQMLHNQGGTCFVTALDTFWPAAPELSETMVEFNSRLSQLSWAIIKARPALFFTWVATAFWISLFIVITTNVALKVLMGLLMVSFALWFASYLFYYLRLGRANSKETTTSARDYFLEIGVPITIAISFALAKILLVIMVNFPDPRYLDAAGVFLPMIPVAFLFVLLRSIHFRLGAAIASKRG
jgi:hypothetical protein